MSAISSYRGNRPTNTHTNTHTPRARPPVANTHTDRTIAIHCAAKLIRSVCE